MKFAKLMALTALSSVGIGMIAVQPADAFLFGGSFGNGTSMNGDDFLVSLEISDLKSDNGAANGNQVPIIDTTIDPVSNTDTNLSKGLFEGAIENFVIEGPSPDANMGPIVYRFAPQSELNLEAILKENGDIEYYFLLPDGTNIFDKAAADAARAADSDTTDAVENAEGAFFKLEAADIAASSIDSNLAVNDLTYILTNEIPSVSTGALIPEDSFVPTTDEVVDVEYTSRPTDNVAVPEPGTVAGLFVFGMVSVAAAINKKKK
ncbi:PEP-CTERM sorting domain-containing protein [Leptothoe sp. LEGE 181152]|nr:PEP-CTERM sorting domain-containing protein [Leptothoe sp. LEGE 181152]